MKLFSFFRILKTNNQRKVRRSPRKSPYASSYFEVETLEKRLVMNADIAGDTLGAAFSVGALDGQQQFSSHVGVGSPDDFFVFTLSAKATVNATVTGSGFPPGVQIIQDSNTNGTVDSGEVKVGAAASSTSVTKYAKSVGTILQPGTYYIRVFQSGVDSDYTLTLSADTAGKQLLSARNLGTLVVPSTTTVNEYVGAGDSTDVFKFKLTGSTATTINLTGLSANADLYLLDSSGATLFSSTNGGTTSETIAQTLAAGTYYVKVVSVSGSTNYALDLIV